MKNNNKSFVTPKNSVTEEVVKPVEMSTDFTSPMKRSAIDVSSNSQKTRKSTFIKDRAPFGNGTFGGHLVPFAFAPYLAGGYFKKAFFDGFLKLEALKHTCFEKIKFRAWSFFVPYYRILDRKSLDRFFSQRQSGFGGSVTSMPLFHFSPTGSGNQREGLVADENGANPIPFFSSGAARHSIVYNLLGYCPSGLSNIDQAISYGKYNSIFPRAYRAICNEWRDKTTIPEYVEYSDFDTSNSNAESASLTSLSGQQGPEVTYNVDDPGFRTKNNSRNVFLMRSPSAKHYANTYRTSVYSNNNAVDTSSLFSHMVSQNMIAEYRSRAENEQLADHEVVAKIRGSRPPRDNQVLLLGYSEQDINIIFQPQTSENNELTLGAEGALSYTPLNLEIEENFIGSVDGITMYIFDIVCADGTRFEHAVDFELYKRTVDDYYRPDVAIIKDAPLYAQEVRGPNGVYGGNGVNNQRQVVGYRRKYSEYTKCASFVRGDYLSSNISGSYVIGRENLGGLLAHPVGGGPAVRMVSRDDYHLMLSGFSNEGILFHNHKDYLDYSIRKLLLNDYQGLTHVHYQNIAPYPFYFGGSWRHEVMLPIDDTIDNNLSRVADETSSQWT